MQTNQVSQLALVRARRAGYTPPSDGTFTNRLALRIACAPVVETFPYGKPVDGDQWAHVVGRGHKVTQLRVVG